MFGTQRIGCLLKESPHHLYNFIINKGSTHIAASRDFVMYVLYDDRAIDLLNWMREYQSPGMSISSLP